MKIGIEVNTVKIRKRAKFLSCNLSDYRNMDVANWDQNPLILTERDHLGISQGSIYVNNLTLACYIFMKIGTWYNF